MEKRLPGAALTLAQVEALLGVPNVADPLGIRDRAMLETFYATAIRRSELVNLDMADLDPVGGTLHIRHGKGDKDRVVPIGGGALSWIASYLEHTRPRMQLDASEQALFLSGYGERLSATYLGNWVRKTIEAAQVSRVGSCHLFRHSCATHMLEGGADIRFIQQLLGHEKLETTAIYTQTSIEQLKAVHARTHPAEAPKESRPDDKADGGDDQKKA
jgi:integrase/recombinase XerD